MQNRFVHVQTRFSITMELTLDEARSLENALIFLDDNELLPKFMQELREELDLELNGLQ
jgi:hypothetical protein